MATKNRTIRADERIWEALDKMAEAVGDSANSMACSLLCEAVGLPKEIGENPHTRAPRKAKVAGQVVARPAAPPAAKVEIAKAVLADAETAAAHLAKPPSEDATRGFRAASTLTMGREAPAFGSRLKGKRGK